jgi:hypothetical protein
VSVGHLARILEEAGISTVIIAVKPFIQTLSRLKPPRVLFTPYPMGMPVGPPGNREKQIRVVSAALDLLQSAERAGTITEFPGNFME